MKKKMERKLNLKVKIMLEVLRRLKIPYKKQILTTPYPRSFTGVGLISSMIASAS